MNIETVVNTDREPVSIWKKLNPLWWLVGPDGWTAPTINNGAPYLPGVTNQFVRNFYWFWRNPCMNLVGFVLGVEDNNYRVVGKAPVLLTTLRDATPPQTGWGYAVLHPQSSLGALAVYSAFVALATVAHWAFWIPAAFAFLKFTGPLPYISYNGFIEFYLGWRPASGGFGLKIVKHAQ